MSQKKQSHKDMKNALKQPDTFQTKAIEGLSFAEKNRSLLIGLGALVIVAILAVWGFRAVKDGQQRELNQELAEIEKVKSKEREASTKKAEALRKEIEKLEAKDTKGSTSQKPEKEAAEQGAKISELNKQLEKVEPDHSGSAKQFAEYFKNHPEDGQGLYAGMQAALYYAKSGKLSQAKDILVQITESSRPWPTHKVQSRFTLASVQEDLGEYQGALKTLKELEGLVSKDSKSRVLLAKGRVLVELKRKNEALEVFNSLISDHEQSLEADVARSFKAFLN